MSKSQYQIQYHKLLDDLTKKIETEQWDIGSKLPTINDLATEHNVATSTIREVYRSLESKGYISIQQGRGTFVSYDRSMQFTNVSRSTFIRLIQLSEFRVMIEPTFAALAAREAYQDEINLLVESATRMKKMAQNNQPTFEEDLNFHRLIVKATHNEYSLKVYEELQEELKLMRAHIKKRGMIEKAVHYHELIAQSIANRDTERAKMYMESHIKNNSDLAMYELSEVDF